MLIDMKVVKSIRPHLEQTTVLRLAVSVALVACFVAQCYLVRGIRRRSSGITLIAGLYNFL